MPNLQHFIKILMNTQTYSFVCQGSDDHLVFQDQGQDRSGQDQDQDHDHFFKTKIAFFKDHQIINPRPLA